MLTIKNGGIMKKSEIIKYLNEKKCRVISYGRVGDRLIIYLYQLSGSDIVYLANKGLWIDLGGSGNKIHLEINGNIEWD